ncbi:site-specific DNA-methyltransferase [Paraburkholderia phymatum]|uniref:Site-specific DNA-methyltransferase n=1 Tax=Paraburkholderia phymatum TaxID=148447 RepID=A0ACC6U106_9BURK
MDGMRTGMAVRSTENRFALHHGDCMDVLKTIADESVDSIVCDPPYHLTQVSRGGHARTNNPEMPHGRHRIGDKGFMGKVWDGGDIAHRVEMWAECLRVLKPGGHLLAFAATRTYHRMTCAIEDAGFEIRDMVPWHYGSGFPKSKNLDGQWDGWGTALKPATEPICMARKPLIGTVAENVAAYGTGAINIDACRVHADDAIGGEYTVKRFAPGASVVKDGNWKQDVEFRGEMKAGRWPANVIHDGSPEVLDAFPDAPGQLADVSYQGDARKTQNVYGAMNRGHEPSRDRTYADNGGTNFAMKPGARRLDTGSAARFFYCAKASRADRNEGIGGSDAPAVETKATMRDRETADWQERNGNFHPTVKPTDLMAYLCRLVTPPGGTVLDPFMGSGSTGKAAMREGFRFIGIDMTPEYVEIAKARIQFEADRVEQTRIDASRQSDLFSEVA